MRNNSNRLILATIASVLTIPAAANAELIYGLTATSSASTSAGVALVRFDSATPGTITAIGNFTGIVAGQTLRSMDFRPANGQLYAISTDGAAAAQLYTVNLATAALTPVGAGFALTGNVQPSVEMDFNPAADRIRIITRGAAGSANNFRANPNDGTLVAVDTSLSWAAGDPTAATTISIIGAAYTNNVAGATSTTLFAWEYNSDALVTVGGIGGTPSPNGGVLTTVENPTAFLTTNAGLGMDISGVTGTLYVTHDDPATGTLMSLFTRNITTGAEALVGNYPAGTFIVDISAAPAAIPEPTGLAAVAGIVGLGLTRNRRMSR
jgi:hypothetical protein